MRTMIFDETIVALCLKPSTHTARLQDDIAQLSIGVQPTTEQLRAAPFLDRWIPVIANGHVRLSGEVTGHPLLYDGRVLTSPVCAIDIAAFAWVRTARRWYSLGDAHCSLNEAGTDR
jgi:hypothetical protein